MGCCRFSNTYYFVNRRAGLVLDVNKEGYYNTELCLEDFENVNCKLKGGKATV